MVREKTHLRITATITIPVSPMNVSSEEIPRSVPSREHVSKGLPMEPLSEPIPIYGVLVTCFSSHGGFSSAAVSSPVLTAPSGVWSALFLGSVVENGWVFACGVRGELKIPDVGVTKVREWFVGSGDSARDESDTPEMPRDSEKTSGREIAWSVTCEGFSSSTSRPESMF